jgi:Holliday junction resolvase RusA-like endonuclease
MSIEASPIHLAFTVYGKPQPAGSKRAFAVRKGGVATGQIAVTDANPKAKSWQREVSDVARWKMQERPDWTPFDYDLWFGPLVVAMTFYVARPKSHYGTGKNADTLKPSAPTYPTGKPDALKLARGTEDACTGIVWRDDAQVVELTVRKLYGLPERCEIEVRPLD